MRASPEGAEPSRLWPAWALLATAGLEGHSHGLVGWGTCCQQALPSLCPLLQGDGH